MNSAEQEIRAWIERVVIGLNLCPFAGTPYREGKVRIALCEAETERLLLKDLQRELELLDESPDQIETTLLIVARLLAEFEDYNQFLDRVDGLLLRGGWEGVYQVASFHPHYRFAGTAANDRGNLTNRAPWPILHIIREASIDRALQDYPDPDAIPERNIQKLQSLTAQEIRELFPGLAAEMDDTQSSSPPGET